MSFDSQLIYRSGDLTIQAELGEITNTDGDSARLGPINTQVLLFLLANPDRVVSRSELFDSVWKNQVVNDDTLTRCISDIRARLSELSTDKKYIETLPKRGYRWSKEVALVNPSIESNNNNDASNQRGKKAETEPDKAPAKESNTTGTNPRSLSWFNLLKQSVSYLAAFIIIASLGAWLLNQLADSDHFRIAILPTQSPDNLRPSAQYINDQLIETLMQVDQIEVLSKSAVDSRPSNPFPYFFYEFGARWVIESELGQRDNTFNHSISLVDARTGIVIIRQSYPLPENFIKNNEEENKKIEGHSKQALKEFIDYLESEVQI